MSALKALGDDLDVISTQISQRTREASAGIVAIWWALLIGQATGTLASNLKDEMMGPVILAAVTVFLDFIQYVIGYEMTRRILRRAEDQIRQKKEPDTDFDKKSLLYRLRVYCFYAKQLSIAAALAWFVFTISVALK